MARKKRPPRHPSEGSASQRRTAVLLHPFSSQICERVAARALPDTRDFSSAPARGGARAGIPPAGSVFTMSKSELNWIGRKIGLEQNKNIFVTVAGKTPGANSSDALTPTGHDDRWLGFFASSESAVQCADSFSSSARWSCQTAAQVWVPWPWVASLVGMST